MNDEEICLKAKKAAILMRPVHHCYNCGNEADWVDDEGDLMCEKCAAEELRENGFMGEDK